MGNIFKKALWLWTGLMWAGVNASILSAAPYSEDYTQGLNIPDVVAHVNGVEISSKHVKFEFNKIFPKLKKKPDAMEQANMVRSIIHREVIRELMYQKAKDENFQASKMEIDKEMESLKSVYTDDNEFQAALKMRDLTEEELRKSIETDILSRQVIQKFVKRNVHLTNAEVKQYYDENREKFKRPEAYRTRHIFVSIFPEDMLKKSTLEELQAKKDEYSVGARKKAEEILEKVRAGGDFGELAKKYSQDGSTAQNGGELDYIYKGFGDPDFEAAATKLKDGEYSDVVETPYGFHIIQMMDTKPSDYAPYEDLKETIQRKLYMDHATNELKEFLEVLRKQAKIEILF